MANTSIGMTGIAARYAGALFDLAKDNGVLDVIAADLSKLSQAYDQSEDLRRLMKSPVIGREGQGKAMAVLVEKLELSGLTKNFVGKILYLNFAISGIEVKGASKTIEQNLYLVPSSTATPVPKDSP